MKKINVLIIILVSYFCLFGFFALDLNQGTLGFLFNPGGINIISPLNTTYSFLAGEGDYTILINASWSANLSSWGYFLRDIRYGTIRTGNFSIGNANSSLVSGYLNASRWDNELIIYGTDVNGLNRNNSVIFFVNVSNSAPTLINLSANIYVCENNALSYFFTSYDPDWNVLEVDIIPKYPFYITPFVYTDSFTLISQIYSGILRKNRVGVYQEKITVSDGMYSDMAITNITVIEVNNAPVIQNIGVQTIWLLGENSVFNKTVEVTDVEDGNQNSGELNFSIVFSGEELFNITSLGLMYFKADASQIGVYNISVCVADKGINNIHSNISLCNQNGTSIETCKNFSLTVTNENRAPTITLYSPANLFVNVYGNDITQFNITKYDPDFTITDSYWYVDNVFNAYYSGSSNDFFNYRFGCGISGTHYVKVEITDGLLNDSLIWSINVSQNACSVPSAAGGGGGGGGGGVTCLTQMACEEWAVCQSSGESLTSGLISGEDYRVIKEKCDKMQYDEANCGFQLRTCTDLKNCTKIFPLDNILRECFFSLNPSCFDGIKNCHDNGCEVLVDCGGPCSDCPTCSDRAFNQNEDGIDCGGPCSLPCKVEKGKCLPFFSICCDNPGTCPVIVVITVLMIIIVYIGRRIYLLRIKKRRIIYRYFKDG